MRVKKLTAVILIAAIWVAILPVFSAAEDIPGVDNHAVFLKQDSGSSDCVITSVAMMLRRRLILENSPDWRVPNVESVKEITGQMMPWSFSAFGFAVSSGNDFGENDGERFAVIAALLDEHPEGIVIHSGLTSPNHAVLLTHYEGETLFCVEPAGQREGIIPLDEATYGLPQKELLLLFTRYWFISTPYADEPAIVTGRTYSALITEPTTSTTSTTGTSPSGSTTRESGRTRPTRDRGTSPGIPVSGDVPVERLPGDVNGDGVVDIADAGEILKRAIGGASLLDELPDGQCAIADMDGDGEITVADALAVLMLAIAAPVARETPSATGEPGVTGFTESTPA